MENCIFCKIVDNRLPAYKVYEDKKYLAFLDIFPRTKGHVLVIPKNHYRWVYNVPNFGEYWEIILKVTRAIQKKIKPDFINYITYGMDVPHAHIHVLPQTGKSEIFPEIIKLLPEDLQNTADMIKKGF